MADLLKGTRQTYQDMKNRCYNSRSQQYKNYGARGIIVCQSWLESFDNFLRDMGLRPHGLTLERKDNDAGYFPLNCRWATRKEQRANQRTCRRITYDGKTQPLRAWAKEYGLVEQTLNRRLRNGLDMETALTLPVNPIDSLHGKIGARIKYAALATKERK